MSLYKRTNRRRWIWAFLFLGILYFGTTALRIARFAERNETRHADVAIVLGTAIRGEEPSPVFRERINHGIYLYKKGYVRKILFTGGKLNGNSFSEAHVARRYAVKQGVPLEDILVEEKSRNTFQNLKFAQELMVSHQLENALVVSDPLHMKRGMRMAEAAGISAWPSPAEGSMFRSWQAKGIFLMSETFFYIIYEVAGGG